MLEARGEVVNHDTILTTLGISNLPSRKSILTLFDEYMTSKRTGITHLTYKRSNQLRDKLHRFEAFLNTRLDPASFNRIIFTKFTQFLSLEDNLNDNSIKRHIQTLRGFLKHYNPDGNFNYMAWKEVYYDVIYLEDWEISTLKNAKNLPAYLDKVRDMFLIAYYTGVRWSDLTQIKLSNVREGVFSIMQTKTKSPAYPPFVNGLKELLEKHHGICPNESNQKMNEYLKILFKDLGLDRPITIHKRYQGTVKRTVMPLYEVITCHVARKTFIMTLLDKGVPLNDVMHMSGHSDFNSMRPYIAVNRKRLSRLSKEISEGGYM